MDAESLQKDTRRRMLYGWIANGFMLGLCGLGEGIGLSLSFPLFLFSNMVNGTELPCPKGRFIADGSSVVGNSVGTTLAFRRVASVTYHPFFMHFFLSVNKTLSVVALPDWAT